MIKQYQELLNECIDIQEWKDKHKNMLSTLERMKMLKKECKK